MSTQLRPEQHFGYISEAATTAKLGIALGAFPCCENLVPSERQQEAATDNACNFSIRVVSDYNS